MPNYHHRLSAVQKKMSEQGIDLLFLSISANLHYLTGIGREEPNFGNTIYPGEWLTGAWIPQQGAPVLTLPRMMAEFHMGAVTGFDVRVLPDAEDPAHAGRYGLGRIWYQCRRTYCTRGSLLGGGGDQHSAVSCRRGTQSGIRDLDAVAPYQG